jgi:hypothetical protein
MMRVWKTGESLQITCEGRTVPGTVRLASGNGWSLMLEFEAVLAGHVAMMPVLWDDRLQAFASVMTGVAVELGETEEEGGLNGESGQDVHRV